MRVIILKNDIVTGRGRKIFQFRTGVFLFLINENSIRGDGAIVSKNRQDGMSAGRTNFKV